jgi:GrpB-like predicted nucleotidyltransferase (UPF0157 family)
MSDSDAARADEPIRLAAYDPAWPVMFQQEADTLAEVLGPWITGGVHHVGSTAVPGLLAKPIIDIMVGVADLESSRPCLPLAAGIGYCYAPHRAEIMHWFCKPEPSRRTHHLQLVPAGSRRFADVLGFRDYLRAHPEKAAEYARLKQELAARHTADRDAYTEGKSALVAELSAAADKWRRAERG